MIYKNKIQKIFDNHFSKTFNLGKQEHFNDQLNNPDLQFTFLVPTDQAWDQIKKDFATAYKVTNSTGCNTKKLAYFRK